MNTPSRHRLSSLVLATALTAAAPAALAAPGGQHKLHGYEEVPAVSSPGKGTVALKTREREGTIEYRLSYEGLEGTPTQAHIHVAQKGVNGGVSVWLCANPDLLPEGTPIPDGTQLCPDPSGTISGVITADDVVGPAAQLVGPGEIGELIEAIRAGVAYVNVHTTAVPSGEIRSQIGH